MGSAEVLFLHLAQALVIGCYLAGTVLILTGTLTRRRPLTEAGLWCAVAGFAMHTLDLGLVTSRPGNSLLEGGFHFRFFAWLLVLCWFLVWRWMKLGFLAVTLAPLALAFYIASLVSGQLTVAMPKQWAMLFFGLHIGSLFASMALLALASGAGMGFIRLEARIKAKEKLDGAWADTPSLSTLDRANHWAVILGFPLYTLGLASGFVWASLTWERTFSGDPKEVAALGVWLLFAYLFHQRVVAGWLGRKAALLAIWIFALAILSMVGINFLVPSHHQFLRPGP